MIDLGDESGQMSDWLTGESFAWPGGGPGQGGGQGAGQGGHDMAGGGGIVHGGD